MEPFKFRLRMYENNEHVLRGLTCTRVSTTGTCHAGVQAPGRPGDRSFICRRVVFEGRKLLASVISKWLLDSWRIMVVLCCCLCNFVCKGED
jgi:hypothetical protein